MRTRQTMTWTVLCSCLSIWAASSSWGYEPAAGAVGLDGIFPSSAPQGLTEDDFKSLEESIDPTWKAWTLETGTFVKDFYEGHSKPVAEQRAAVDRLQVKVKTIEKALADARYRSIHKPLQSLYSKLSPEATLAKAILDAQTAEPSAARDERLQPAVAGLHDSANQLAEFLKSYHNGSDWVSWIQLNDLQNLQASDESAPATVEKILTKLGNRESYGAEVRDFVSQEAFLAVEDSLRKVRDAAVQPEVAQPAQLTALYAKLVEALAAYRAEPTVSGEANVRQILSEVQAQSPDGGAAVASAVSKSFLNYNLRVSVSEGLLNRFMSESRREQSQIRDRFQQASIYGYQCADIVSTIDLLPSGANAKFNLNLSGSVYANTNGVTHEATVHSVGNHRFVASKTVTFDGHNFFGEPGRVSAYANTQTVGAATKFSGIPIFGRVANNIAIREADKLRPQANAAAVQKITQQVSAQLEAESNDQLGNATKQLETKTYGPLRKHNLYPSTMALTSTDTELRLWARVMEKSELAGSEAVPVATVPADGIVAQIHESLLNHTFDRLGLNGQTMTEDEVRLLLQDRLTEILGRPVEIPKPTPSEENAEVAGNTLVFAEKDAVRFTIHGGVVTLFIKAGLKRDNGDDIPTQVISVPFTPTIQGDKIVLSRGNVGVKPVERPSNVAAQVARANVMRQKIQSALPEKSVKRSFNVTTPNDRIITLSVTDLTAEGGWLVITMR
ncbi:hypothetical protein SH668x_003753 [Planctomicrobium sp. SH668]|uniref:hypothetical protein n=1 Tax=Planctomicrobium sp. SH668 TaxID=3448126 RepID=UPI003F5C76B5